MPNVIYKLRVTAVNRLGEFKGLVQAAGTKAEMEDVMATIANNINNINSLELDVVANEGPPDRRGFLTGERIVLPADILKESVLRLRVVSTILE